MTSFKLIDVSYGWSHYATPDDITFKIESGSTSVQLFASLRDLGVLYAAVVYNEDLDYYIGTGDHVKACFGNRSVLKINDIILENTIEDLQNELQPLLEDIFIIKDEIDPGNRKTVIEDIDTYIDKYYFHNDGTVASIYS